MASRSRPSRSSPAARMLRTHSVSPRGATSEALASVRQGIHRRSSPLAALATTDGQRSGAIHANSELREN